MNRLNGKLNLLLKVGRKVGKKLNLSNFLMNQSSIFRMFNYLLQYVQRSPRNLTPSFCQHLVK